MQRKSSLNHAFVFCRKNKTGKQKADYASVICICKQILCGKRYQLLLMF